MASGGNFVLDKGYDLAAGQVLVKYAAVKLSASETVTPVTGEGDVILGIAQFSVSAAELLKGKGASVRLFGISLCKVGTGGVTLGTLVVSDAAGLVVASNAGARPIGICLDTGVAGDYVSVVLTPGLTVI